MNFFNKILYLYYMPSKKFIYDLLKLFALIINQLAEWLGDYIEYLQLISPSELVLLIGVIFFIFFSVFFSNYYNSDVELGAKYRAWVTFLGLFVILIYTVINVFRVYSVSDYIYHFGDSNMFGITATYRATVWKSLLGLFVFCFAFVYFAPWRAKDVAARPELKWEFESLLMVLLMLLGMSFVLSADNFISFYVSLELQSFCIVVLLFLSFRNDRTYKPKISYFITLLVSSILLLFSFSILYLEFGTFSFFDLSLLVNARQAAGVHIMGSYGFHIFVVVVLVVSLFIKVGLFPIHVWVPEIYEVSSDFFLSIISTVSKIFGFAIVFKFLEIFWDQPDLFIVIYIFSFFSIAYGVWGALFEARFRRLLGFSAIAHMGYIFLIASVPLPDAAQYAFFYLLIYVLTILPILCVLMELTDRGLRTFGGPYVRIIETVADFERINFQVSSNTIITYLFFATFFFSFIGIPPFGGFLSKFFIISFFISIKDFVSAAVVGFFSIVSAYYYLRIIKHMFFSNRTTGTQFVDFMVIEFSSFGKLIVVVFGVLNACFIFLTPLVFFIIRIALVSGGLVYITILINF